MKVATNGTIAKLKTTMTILTLYNCIIMHKNKHLLAGFAGGKSMRYKRNKQLHPHGEGKGLPKAAGNKKSGINLKYVEKMKIRNLLMKRRILKHPNDKNVPHWKALILDRKKEIELRS